MTVDEATLPENSRSNVYENARPVKSGPGILYGFTAYSSKGSGQFILAIDSAAPPSAGAVPEAIFTVGAAANVAANWIPGRTFQRGIWLCNSSTGPTLTAGSADTWFDAQFA